MGIFIPPYHRMGGILSLRCLCRLKRNFMYGNRFLNPRFADWREILHGSSATPRTGLLPFWGIAPGMAEFWASAGAVWQDMLLAESLV